jgi:signal transduction histidine kinase
VVSHELRTPLNAILGWATLVRSGSLAPGATARALEAIERNAQVQRQVVDDLLDVSTIVAGKMTLDVQPVDVGAVVAASVDSIRPSASARRLRLDVDIEPRLPAVAGDPVRLQQVFSNLLSNAVKFTPEHGEVRVSASASPNGLRVEVCDTGIGIDREFLPHVFERFRQHDSSTTREYGGLGLGLALVRNLVEAHHGTVEARSEGKGKGATFTVTLPVGWASGLAPSQV